MAKNTKDKRFQKTEDAIFRALLQLTKTQKYLYALRPCAVCKKAKISRSTFSRHYKNLNDVFRQKDREMLQDFSKINFKNSSQEEVWQKTLFFIQRYHGIFEARHRQADYQFFIIILKKLSHKITLSWTRYNPKITHQIFGLFYAETLGVLNLWISSGMKTVAIPKTAKLLARLTLTTDKRWLKILQMQ